MHQLTFSRENLSGGVLKPLRILRPARLQYRGCTYAKSTKRRAQKTVSTERVNALGHEEEQEVGEDEEDDDAPIVPHISEEDQRLTAEYLASLDSQWGKDPPHHRSGTPG